jgi:hypothetical protein
LLGFLSASVLGLSGGAMAKTTSSPDLADVVGRVHADAVDAAAV